MMCNDVQWCAMMCNDVQWCAMMCNDVQWCAMMCNDVQWCAMVHSCVITNMLCYAGGKKVLAEHPDKGGDPKKFQLLNKARFVSVCPVEISRIEIMFISCSFHVHFMFYMMSICSWAHGLFEIQSWRVIRMKKLFWQGVHLHGIWRWPLSLWFEHFKRDTGSRVWQ